MTREIGSEFEFPKTWTLISRGSSSSVGDTYSHCDDEVGLPLLEAKTFGNDECSKIGDDGLDDKDDGDHSEVSQLLSSQLRGKLGKDCIVMLAVHAIETH